MRSFLLLPVFLLSVTIAVAAQDVASSASPHDARFVIVQLPWDTSVTFRLDRYRGTVDRLGTCAKDDSVGSDRCWKEMIVIDNTRGASQRPHFQIVLTVAVKGVLLLDTDSGKTWQYALDKTEKWHPFIDCSDKTNARCLWRPIP